MDQQENPFGPTGYAGPIQQAPATGLARTFGTLNIVFGVLLVLCGMIYGFYLFIFAALMPAMGEQIATEMHKQREQKIARLQEQLDDPAADEDQESLNEQLQKAKEEGDPDMPDLGKMFGEDDPQMRLMFLSDVVSGFLLNVGLFISGIGLVTLKSWGRVLAQWVNVLKIARLVLIYGLLVNLWLVPVQREHLLEAARQAGPKVANGAAEAAQGMGIFIHVASIVVLLAGVIYPLLALAMLSRASVKAAFETEVPGPA